MSISVLPLSLQSLVGRWKACRKRNSFLCHMCQSATKYRVWMLSPTTCQAWAPQPDPVERASELSSVGHHWPTCLPRSCWQNILPLGHWWPLRSYKKRNQNPPSLLLR